MVGAVLAGDGLGRLAEIASEYAGAPVAVVVPGLNGGSGAAAPAELERYVASRLNGGRVARPDGVAAEVPIVSGDEELGAALMLGRGGADAGEDLHVAAVAGLTGVAGAGARGGTGQSPGGPVLGGLPGPDDPGAAARGGGPGGPGLGG